MTTAESPEPPKADIAFDRSPPGTAGEVQDLSALVRRVVAPNPGPFTFTGTCGYIVGRGRVAVIDPGPDDPQHIARLQDILRGEDIAYVMATHTHRDHSPGATALSKATGAPLVGCARAFFPEGVRPPRSQDLDYAPDIALAEGDAVSGPGFTLRAVETPGHAANHLAFALEEEQSLFSGDVVMAWSTTVIAPPDGNLAAYMRSLDKLRAREDKLYWPGHGGPVRDPRRFVRALANHRRHRGALIVARLKAGDRTIDALVDRLYVGLDPRLRGGAARSVLAHLEELVAQGRATCEGPVDLDGVFALVAD